MFRALLALAAFVDFRAPPPDVPPPPEPGEPEARGSARAAARELAVAPRRRTGVETFRTRNPGTRARKRWKRLRRTRG